MTPPNIPEHFQADAPRLTRDLARLSSGLVSWAKGLPDPTNQVPLVSALPATTLAFGQITRVAPIDGQVLELTLPQRSRANGGRTIQIARMSSTGQAVVIAVPGMYIDGRSSVLLLASRGITTIVYDGASDYLSDGAAVDVGAGL